MAPIWLSEDVTMRFAYRFACFLSLLEHLVVGFRFSLGYLCGLNGDHLTVWPTQRHPPTQMSFSRDPSSYRERHQNQEVARSNHPRDGRGTRSKGIFFLFRSPWSTPARGSGGIISTGMISSDMSLPFHDFLPDSDAHLDYVPVRFISKGEGGPRFRRPFCRF